MTPADPTLLVPPRTLRADRHATVWHAGLVQGPRWVTLTLMADLAPEVVSAHRGRYDPAAPAEERRRAVSLIDAVQATITGPGAADGSVSLWQGGSQGLDPLAAHLFTDHTLAPGRYTLEVRIAKPDGAAASYRDQFTVPAT